MRFKHLGGLFGPADINPRSPNCGCITTTSKLAWQHFKILSSLKECLDIPMGFDADVNKRQELPVTYRYLREMNNHYLAFTQLEDHIANYIITDGIEGLSVIKGGFYLAKGEVR